MNNDTRAGAAGKPFNVGALEFVLDRAVVDAVIETRATPEAIVEASVENLAAMLVGYALHRGQSLDVVKAQVLARLDEAIAEMSADAAAADAPSR